ncbi:MAG: hypothetical protein BAJALOKI1v1_140016 [Promethearchaeota archaeon]|nr:MAG: hypothetical protein BAJALOKI1v1_140016 [Candidatus Lokiarchaeota archaeon]
MKTKYWNINPIINAIIDILIDSKGEALDRRIEELLKKDYKYINQFYLQEIFMKMESANIIKVFRISKNKKRIILNKDTKTIKKKIVEESL